MLPDHVAALSGHQLVEFCDYFAPPHDPYLLLLVYVVFVLPSAADLPRFLLLGWFGGLAKGLQFDVMWRDAV